jgi:hypothetical protein
MSRLKLISLQIMILLLGSAFIPPMAPAPNLAAASQTLFFLSKADAFVYSAQPDTNYGTLTNLRAFASPVVTSYLRFNVSGLAGLEISSARLLVHVNTTSASPLNLQVVENNTWGETSLTYSNAPALGGVLASVPSVSAGTWLNFDVSTYVSQEGLFSFAITTPGKTTAFLDSRESLSFSPRLVLVVNPLSDPVLVGAGDIADCGSSGDEATAKLVNAIRGTVFTAGDNVYPSGSASQFTKCYSPSWGVFKTRTKPAPGNHDYETSGGAGYYSYFGAAAGAPGKGYYSYDLGAWHIVVLNTEISHAAGSPQEKWLRADLAAHRTACTLAVWHEPLFSSGSKHGSNSSARPLFQALYDYHVEVVVNGHEHNYERFAPQSPTGVATSRGVREFVAGMGGKDHYGFGSPLRNSQVRNGTTFGVLKFTLHATSYDWKFIPVAGKTFTDSGTAQCIP